MDGIDKFINDFADNYDGGGCCSYNEWFDDDSGMGHGLSACHLGKGRSDSNGCWDSNGFGEGIHFGGLRSDDIPNDVIGHCYVNVENLYGQHR